MLLPLQMFNGRATLKQLVQNWSLSYVGNMIGTMTVIALMTGGAVFPYEAAGVLNTAMPKVSLTFQQVIALWVLWFALWVLWFALWVLWFALWVLWFAFRVLWFAFWVLWFAFWVLCLAFWVLWFA